MSYKHRVIFKNDFWEYSINKFNTVFVTLADSFEKMNSIISPTTIYEIHTTDNKALIGYFFAVLLKSKTETVDRNGQKFRGGLDETIITRIQSSNYAV